MTERSGSQFTPEDKKWFESKPKEVKRSPLARTEVPEKIKGLEKKGLKKLKPEFKN